ncbi:hypothetical protein BOX15_Mlig001303g3 [Macrostomum lignano]|uniref:Phosphotransferase n=1 Tax=Macrostomum lignano TaxID=282301 RepID=A0A267DZJ2_9PLAT|nr:hypothetical protein BOX15_Mlig001303g3 [Macrostomum lignano]
MEMSSAPKFVFKDSVKVPKSLLEGLPCRLSFDNGATLSKILYVTSDSTDSSNSAAVLNFVTVAKSDFQAAMRWIAKQPDCQQRERQHLGGSLVKMTGVNFAYQDLMKETFNANCEHVIELLTQVRGCHWMVTNLTDEQAFLPAMEPDPLFQLKLDSPLMANIMEKFKIDGADTAAQFPAILVCLGSGSMISVLDAEGKMSSFHFCLFGGKSLQGMARLMIGTSSYDELMALAEKGDRANVDLLVREVIASDPASPYGQFNGDIPMMHFGKAAEDRLSRDDARKEDVARSLVSLFCANLLGSLISISTLTKVPKVYFGGNFFLNPLARREFENAKCLLMQMGAGFQHRFLRNAGHLGAVGALVATNADAGAYLKFA